MHETRTLIIKTGRNSFKAENNLKKIYICINYLEKNYRRRSNIRNGGETLCTRYY